MLNCSTMAKVAKALSVSIPSDNKKKIIIGMSALTIVVLVTAGYFIFSKSSADGTEMQQTLQQIDNTDNWNIFWNEEHDFELKYPGGWLVNHDDARYFESNESYPRFTVTERGLIKDSKCYATIIFKDSKNPEKSTYSLYSEVNEKQNCQQLLDQILSTFKFTGSSVAIDAIKGLTAAIKSNTVFRDWYNTKQEIYSDINHFSHYLTGNHIAITQQVPYDGGAVCVNQKSRPSPDGNKIVCISAGSNSGSDILIYDKEKKISGRIESCPTCSDEDGFWLDNNRFVFLSNYKDDEFQIYKEFIVVQQFDFGEDRSDSWSAGVKK